MKASGFQFRHKIRYPIAYCNYSHLTYTFCVTLNFHGHICLIDKCQTFFWTNAVVSPFSDFFWRYDICSTFSDFFWTYDIGPHFQVFSGDMIFVPPFKIFFLDIWYWFPPFRIFLYMWYLFSFFRFFLEIWYVLPLPFPCYPPLSDCFWTYDVLPPFRFFSGDNDIFPLSQFFWIYDIFTPKIFLTQTTLQYPINYKKFLPWLHVNERVGIPPKMRDYGYTFMW